MDMAPIIPLTPVFPVTFKTSVEKSKVAIAIPETGLLLLPTSPTIREETVAKKNPNTTISSAPIKETGIAGRSQIAKISAREPPRTMRISRSCSVRRLPALVPPFNPFNESLNVVRISGRDLIKLIIPPAATAPAPI